MITIVEALRKIRPNSPWFLENDLGYAGLLWQDEHQTKPTEAELDAEIIRLQAEYDSLEYQRLRQPEYPTMQEQLDMQYWDSIDGTTTWQDAIDAVKAKYPKPTES